MELRPVEQEMISLAAVGSPEGRERLRDATDIMLNCAGGICDTPGGVQVGRLPQRHALNI